MVVSSPEKYEELTKADFAQAVQTMEVLGAMADAYVKANTGKGLTARESMTFALDKLLEALRKRGHHEEASLILDIAMNTGLRDVVTR